MVDARHRGQGDAIAVRLGAGLGRAPARQVEEAFERAYVALYGRRPPGVEMEVVTWRLRVSGPEPRLNLAAAAAPGAAGKGRRQIWDARRGGFVEAAVYDRYRLRPRDKVRGPAVIEERESTLVLGLGGRATADRLGNVLVDVGNG